MHFPFRMPTHHLRTILVSLLAVAVLAAAFGVPLPGKADPCPPLSDYDSGACATAWVQEPLPAERAAESAVLASAEARERR
jgi:hypothetical protein